VSPPPVPTSEPGRVAPAQRVKAPQAQRRAGPGVCRPGPRTDRLGHNTRFIELSSHL